MPPIDPNIILGVRPAQISQQDPLQQFGRAMALKQSMTAGDVQALQAKQAQRSMALDDARQAAFRQSGGDRSLAMKILGEQGDFAGVDALQKSELERRKAEAGIGKDEAAAAKDKYDVAIKGIERRASVLSLANPQNWGAIRRQIALDNPQAAASMPEQFDPTWVQTSIAQGQTLTQRLADQRAREQAEETRRHNQVSERTAQGQLGVAQGNLTVNRDRLAYDKSKPDPKLREDADNLRKEFESKEAVKRYRDVVPIAEAARASPDTRAGDIQLAYAVGKILDPNSVVREGELALVGNAATLPEKLQGEIRTLVMGKGRMTPETRGQLQVMLDSAVGQRKASYDAERGSYEGIVTRRGYKPEDVFIDTPRAADAAKPKVDEAAKTIGNKKYVKVNGQWFEQN